MSQTFTVSGMTCQHCVARVQTALSSVAGVSGVVVSLTPPRAVVMSHDNQPIDFSTLAAALAGTPFSMTETPVAAVKPPSMKR